MRSNRNRTAKEKRWHDACASYGSVMTHNPNVEIHHLWGANTKSQGLEIGEIAVIPVTKPEHDFIHNMLGRSRHQIEKGLFLLMCRDMGYPLPDRLMDAILDYRR